LKHSSKFTLSKWYMDCVSNAGDVFIGYAATLRWKALSINYASVLEQPAGTETSLRTSLLGYSPPEHNGSSLTWIAASLGVNAAWESLSEPIERTIFESDGGDIVWRCIAPIAAAQVQTQGQPNLKGLGYVEHISLTIPPWQLPMDELRWGRLLSERSQLTWIEWRGVQPLTLVFHNGVLVENIFVTDDELVLPDGNLKISRVGRRVLRQGTLVNTALSVIPGIQHVIPHRILDARETKWCSRGKLTIAGEAVAEGWVIHEIVRWGK